MGIFIVLFFFFFSRSMEKHQYGDPKITAFVFHKKRFENDNNSCFNCETLVLLFSATWMHVVTIKLQLWWPTVAGL